MTAMTESIDRTDGATGRGGARPGAGAAAGSAARLTRALLACGIVAGPVYVVVSLAQALTRDGFDLTRHAWSLLANGDLGWIQVTNLVLAGLLTIAFAVGLRRASGGQRAGAWAPWLLGIYGASLVAAGAFRADPALGFPAGTPAGDVTPSLSGILHFVAGGIGFPCLALACFALGRRFAAAGRPGWATWSRVTGVLFLLGFAGIASGAAGAGPVLGFVAVVVLVWAWVTAVAADQRRAVPRAGA